MSKRARTSKIEKWIKEGRGSGIGADYKCRCEKNLDEIEVAISKAKDKHNQFLKELGLPELS
nr:hypothetical protein [Metasolibacillus meyeri]